MGAALLLKTGRSRYSYYLVARGGKILGDDAAATLAMLGVGSGDLLELRSRLLGGTVRLRGVAATVATPPRGRRVRRASSCTRTSGKGPAQVM